MLHALLNSAVQKKAPKTNNNEVLVVDKIFNVKNNKI